MQVSADPEYYKKTPKEAFTLNNDVEDIYKAWDRLVPESEWDSVEYAVMELVQAKVHDLKGFNKVMTLCRRVQKKQHKKSQMLHVLSSLMESESIPPSVATIDELEALKKLLVKKGGKSTSGVLVITVLTSPYPTVNGKVQRFSCQWNCYYCPNEPGQPRSYLHDEPSVLRANRNHFDPVLQFCDRAVTLALNGHPVDKIELLILGGTWASYPVEYQEEFIRDLFYAANTFYTRQGKRERLSLTEEKARNERARCKIIGITLETRPDCISADELRRFRKYGCTRVQLGVQHTDDEILGKINRGCTNQDTKRALTLLKDSCFKVDIHLMPNLPGSNPEKDTKMFNEVLFDPYLQADQWKIYPCETTPWTVIQKWFQSGEYVPYPEEDLMEVLMDVKSKVHPWIRLNRVIRDIPSQYILGGVDNPSMRQVLQIRMKERGQFCSCIRCREIRDRTPEDIQLVTRQYDGQGATEYFISWESMDKMTILGFVRLRINKLVGRKAASSASLEDEGEDPTQQVEVDDDEEEEEEEEDNATVIEERGREGGTETRRRRARSKSPGAALVKERRKKFRSQAKAEAEAERQGHLPVLGDGDYLTPFPELMGAALIRELHVYGQLIPTVDGKSRHAQHVGLGSSLMREAERVSRRHGARKVAVIAGVGVRDFYRKLGYDLEGESEMMIKYLEPLQQSWAWEKPLEILLILACLLAISYGVMHM